MAECLAPKLLGGSESIMVWGAIWYNDRSDLVVFDKEGSEGKWGGVTAKMYREQIMQGELNITKVHWSTGGLRIRSSKLREASATVAELRGAKGWPRGRCNVVEPRSTNRRVPRGYAR